MLFDSSGKVRVIYLPIYYFRGILGIVVHNVFNMNIAHTDDTVSPLQQTFGNSLRTMVIGVVAKFFQRKAHLTRDLAIQRCYFTGPATFNFVLSF